VRVDAVCVYCFGPVFKHAERYDAASVAVSLALCLNMFNEVGRCCLCGHCFGHLFKYVE